MKMKKFINAPETITDEELDRGLSILEKVLTDCGGKEE